MSPAGCGDGILAATEVCDDGNTQSGDGCSADCATLEAGWVCAEPGIPCVLKEACGNGLIEAGESCDDHNTTAGDGCDAQCKLEPGWTCRSAGIRCTATACGDGTIAGFEECDDGNTTAGDGCSDTCTVEEGHACNVPGQPCVPVVCGNGVREGAEQCDDGNHDLGDGCDPQCHREPQCTNGSCTAVCGDGVVQPPEECDDGNQHNFDGCSSACKVEHGFTCTPKTADPGPTFTVTVVYRDFMGIDVRKTTSVSPHRDFENLTGMGEAGIVGPLFTGTLDPVTHKPQYAFGATGKGTTHGKAAFDQWYKDDPTVNTTIVDKLVLNLDTTSPGVLPGTYVFNNQTFFPLDGRGFTVAGGPEVPPTPRPGGHNFSFTSELRYWFTYKGGEVLSFTGDDDVFVFINGRLAVDIGGVHGRLDGSITLDATAADSDHLTLTKGGTYEAVVFQAERHTTESTYKLTLAGFDAVRSICESRCGDGITTPDEACDDGKNDGSYGSCTPDCKGFGARCGDGVVDVGHETCDDGVNAGGYGGCTPACQIGPHCGDGHIDVGHETCDDSNDDPTDGCDRCQMTIQ